VHGVAGLESNDTSPVELLEVGAELSGSVSVGDIVVVDGGLNSLDIASDVELLDALVKVLDSRMSKIVVTKDLNSLLNLVGGVDVLNGQDSDGLVVAGVTESDTLVGLKRQGVDVLLRNIQVDGDGEESAAGEAQIVDNTLVVLLVQEAFERREASGDDELKIAQLTLGEDNGGESGRLLEELRADGEVAGDKVLKETTVGSVGHCVLCV